MAIELYPHNQTTYERMTEMFRTNTRVGIVQPTGTGKSFLYLKWIEDHPQDTFTILSSSTEIFMQLQEYAAGSGSPDLLKHVQMITYQSLLKMTDEEVQAMHPDKMVLDEFHRTGADQWGPSLQRLLDANPDAQVLGASATPVRYLDDSKDMSSELFDRNLAVEMTLGEAVQRKILPTPTYIPVWYDLNGTMDRYQEDVDQVTDRKKRSELEEKLEQLKRRLEDAYGAEDIFRKHMPHAGKFIVFCRDQMHLDEMKKIISSWLQDVNTNLHMYTSISAQEDKDVQLKAFKADMSSDAIKLLFTIDRLNEGLHVKGIDGVIMLRPTSSPIIYLQQMGRALSVGNNNPLIFDLVNNYENVRIPFQNGSSINVFEKEFRDAMEQDKDSAGFHIFADMMDFTSLFSELEEALYYHSNVRWNMIFQLDEEFRSNFGREPNQGEAYKGIQIGNWANAQRNVYKNGNLSEERKQLLLTIGFSFDLREAEWNKFFELYKDFKHKYDREPKFRECYKELKLGVWVCTQRKAFHKGVLSEERTQKLLNSGFVFDPREAIWQENLELYKEFAGKFDRDPKPAEMYRGVQLGNWVADQKKAFKRGVLSDERKQKILECGLIINCRTSAWEACLEKYIEFKTEFDREPEQNCVYKGINLRNWVHTQRATFKNGTLSNDRKEKLLNAGFIFNGSSL